MEYTVLSAQFMPQLFAQVRSKGSQKNNKRLQSFPINSSRSLCQLNQLIIILHKSGYNRVETELLKTLLNIKHQLMTEFDHLTGSLHILVLAGHYQIVETVEETGYTLNPPIIPLGIQFRRSHKELIETQGIASVIAYKIIRRNDISLGLTHLDTILSCNHSLIEQFLERLIEVDSSDITEELCIESGVQKMKHCMLYTTDIHVNRQIFVGALSRYQFSVILVVHITQEIPG